MSNQPTNEDDYPDSSFLISITFTNRGNNESKVIVTDLNEPRSREEFLTAWHAFAAVAGQAGSRYLYGEPHPWGDGGWCDLCGTYHEDN